jgi:hypothetical protein
MAPTTSLHQGTDSEVREATPSEGSAMFDDECRRLLGISGAEFLSSWDAGDFHADERPAVWTLAALIPYVR